MSFIPFPPLNHGDRELIDVIHSSDQMFQFIGNAAGGSENFTRFEYLRNGYEILQSLDAVLRAAGKDWMGLRSVLEFACGFGRFTRFLVRELPSERIWCSDIQSEATEFAANQFGVGGFTSSYEPGDLTVGRKFEIIYVVSLFSHLPRQRFEQWLTALYSLLDDDGLLLFSTHGEHLCAGQPLDPSGVTFFPNSEIDTLSKSEYGISFVSPESVSKIAEACGIRHLHFVEREVCGHQDLYVATKQPFLGLGNWERSPRMDGNIDEIRIADDSSFFARGWVAEEGAPSPVDSFKLVLEENELTAERTAVSRPDVAVARNRPDWRASGWQLNGTVRGPASGTHRLRLGQESS